MFNEMTPFFSRSAPYIQGPQKQQQFGRKDNQTFKDQQGFQEKQGWKDQQGRKQQQSYNRKYDGNYRNMNQENQEQQMQYFPKNTIDNQNYTQQQQQYTYEYKYKTQEQDEKNEDYSQKNQEDLQFYQKEEQKSKYKEEKKEKYNFESIEKTQLQQNQIKTQNNEQNDSVPISNQQQQQQQQQYLQQQQQEQQSQNQQQQQQKNIYQNQEQLNQQNVFQSQQNPLTKPTQQILASTPVQFSQNMFSPVAPSNPFSIQTQQPQQLIIQNGQGQINPTTPYIFQYLIYPNKQGKYNQYQFLLTQEDLDENYRVLKAQLESQSKQNN